jgi:hypothetical protein
VALRFWEVVEGGRKFSLTQYIMDGRLRKFIRNLRPIISRDFGGRIRVRIAG